MIEAFDLLLFTGRRRLFIAASKTSNWRSAVKWRARVADWVWVAGLRGPGRLGGRVSGCWGRIFELRDTSCIINEWYTERVNYGGGRCCLWLRGLKTGGSLPPSMGTS